MCDIRHQIKNIEKKEIKNLDEKYDYLLQRITILEKKVYELTEK